MINPREEGINFRMKMLYDMEHCPQCGLLPREHSDYACDLRYYNDAPIQEEVWLP